MFLSPWLYVTIALGWASNRLGLAKLKPDLMVFINLIHSKHITEVNIANIPNCLTAALN
jgi:hypothetical protein